MKVFSQIGGPKGLEINTDAGKVFDALIALEGFFNDRLSQAAAEKPDNEAEAEKPDTEAESAIERLRVMQNLILELVGNLHLLDDLNLRQSQTRAVEELYCFLKNAGRGGYRGYFHQPTGAGKTLLMGAISKILNQRTVILVPTANLLNQVRNAFIDQLGFDQADVGTTHDGIDRKIIVATYAAMRRTPSILDSRSLILCDEVHRSLGNRTQGAFGAGIDASKSLILGFTATPRLIRKDVDDFFPICIDQANYRELIDAKVLRKIRLVSVDGQISDSDLEGQGSDFSPEREAEILERELIYRKLILKFIDLRKQINESGEALRPAAFCATIEEAQKFQQIATNEGLRTAIVTGTYSDMSLNDAERKLAVGEIDLIISVNKLTEGWDFPELNCVLLARATFSPVKIIQPVGRAMRNTSASNNQYAYVLYTEWWKMASLPSLNAEVSQSDNESDEVDGSPNSDKAKGDRHPLSIVEAFIRVGTGSEDLEYIFTRVDGSAIRYGREKTLDEIRRIIIDAILEIVPTAELWAKLSSDERGKIHITLDGDLIGLMAIARLLLGVGTNPARYTSDALALGRAIYGNDHECLKDVSPDELRKEVLKSYPTADDWLKIRATQRQSIKISFGGRALGLMMVARIFGLSGNPIGYQKDFLELARAIYGDLETLKYEELVPEKVIEVVIQKYPTPKDWARLQTPERVGLKFTLGSQTFGLSRLATVFGIEGLPAQQNQAFFALGRAIYGDEHECLRYDDVSRADMRNAILAIYPTANHWIGINTRSRKALSVSIGGRDWGLHAINSLFGIAGVSSLESFLALGRAIYGEDNQLLQPVTTDLLKHSIMQIIPTASHWAPIGTRDRRDIKINIGGVDFGIKALGTLFNIDGNPEQHQSAFFALGRAIYGDDPLLDYKNIDYVLIKNLILSRYPDRESMQEMTARERGKIKFNVNGEALGLMAVARICGLEGNPNGSEEIFQSLLDKIYATTLGGQGDS